MREGTQVLLGVVAMLLTVVGLYAAYRLTATQAELCASACSDTAGSRMSSWAPDKCECAK